jgi:hypothetical protein
MWACSKKKMNVAEKLIDAFGALCNIHQKNRDSYNALDIATAKKLRNVVKKLTL